MTIPFRYAIDRYLDLEVFYPALLDIPFRVEVMDFKFDSRGLTPWSRKKF